MPRITCDKEAAILVGRGDLSSTRVISLRAWVSISAGGISGTKVAEVPLMPSRPINEMGMPILFILERIGV